MTVTEETRVMKGVEKIPRVIPWVPPESKLARLA